MGWGCVNVPKFQNKKMGKENKRIREKDFFLKKRKTFGRGFYFSLAPFIVPKKSIVTNSLVRCPVPSVSPSTVAFDVNTAPTCSHFAVLPRSACSYLTVFEFHTFLSANIEKQRDATARRGC